MNFNIERLYFYRHPWVLDYYSVATNLKSVFLLMNFFHHGMFEISVDTDIFETVSEEVRFGLISMTINWDKSIPQCQ